MQVLMIGYDRSLFVEGSDAHERMGYLGEACARLDVIAFTRRVHCIEPGTIGNHVHLHPTNTSTRVGYLLRAYRIGLRLPRPDVISAQDPYECGLVAFLLARKLRVPFELQLHIDPFDREFIRESPLNLARSLIARLLLRRAHGVRAVSERLAQSARAQGAVQTRVLPVYVNLARFTDEGVPRTRLPESYPGHSGYILMASRLVAQKDFTTALNAFRLVQQTLPRAALIIVGDGPLRAHLERTIGEYGLRESVYLVPWADDLVPYYASADVFLVTSRYEGYGRTLIEAGACGCAVVTTDVGIVGECVRSGEEVLVAPVGDERALAEALTIVLKDGDVRMRLGKNARTRAQECMPTRERYREAFVGALASLVSRA